MLLANGIESHVVDAASIAVDRRHRRVKTDAIDGETLLRTLMAWARGERLPAYRRRQPCGPRPIRFAAAAARPVEVENDAPGRLRLAAIKGASADKPRNVGSDVG